jgi:hypothetical protein
MRIIDDNVKLGRALGSPLPAACRHILYLRGDLIAIATFLVIQPADSFDDVQSALGSPIEEDAPPWEWVLDHRGAFEAPVIHSDAGYGTVLIVPDELGMNPKLLNILRAYAQPADPSQGKQS